MLEALWVGALLAWAHGQAAYHICIIMTCGKNFARWLALPHALSERLVLHCCQHCNMIQSKMLQLSACTAAGQTTAA